MSSLGYWKFLLGGTMVRKARSERERENKLTEERGKKKKKVRGRKIKLHSFKN